MSPESLAYLTALFVNFIDQMGGQFTVPVMVPYGHWMGATLSTIALFTTVQGIAAMCSTIWMPKLSDRAGRKLVIMISLFGCTLGYFIQGYSSQAPAALMVTVFIVGRGCTGFFSGTQPVLRAYITEISEHSQDLLKTRLIVLQVASQAAGIALQPIAGSLATFGINIPFFVCFGVGLFGTFWTSVVFREAKQIKRVTSESSVGDAENSRIPDSENPQPSAPSQPAQEGTSSQPLEDKSNPLFDKVIILSFFGFLFLFVFVTAVNILIPTMLEAPSFGLQRDTEEATQGEIAKSQGIVAIPFGVCNIFASLFLYMPLTKKCGEARVLVVAGILATINFGSYGFWITELWQLCLMHGLGGICFGFLIPSVSPLIARYSTVHYRKKMAVCQAIPMFGMQIAWTFGQNILAPVMTNYDAGIKVCWIILGSCIFVFTLCVGCAMVLVERRAPKRNALTSEQQRVLLQAGGEGARHKAEDPDKFIDAMCASYREKLLARRCQLWNGTAQFLYREALEKSLRTGSTIPQLREWDESTKGQEYLEDVYALLLAHPTELEEFCQKFPHIAAAGSDTSDAFGRDYNLARSVPSSPSPALAQGPKSLAEPMLTSLQPVAE